MEKSKSYLNHLKDQKTQPNKVQKPIISPSQNKLAKWHAEFNPILREKATGWCNQLPEVQNV